MSNGDSRALLAKSIITFDYNGFFSELPESIELGYSDNGSPEIEFNPTVPEKFIYVSFWFADKQGKGINKIKLKMYIWNFIQLVEGRIPPGLLNMFFAFTSELYCKVEKDLKDRNKLNSSLKNIVKVQKKRTRGMV